MAMNILYNGETLNLVVQVKNANEVLFNPDSIGIAAISPSGVEIVHLSSDDPPTIFTEATGVYQTYFDASEVGTWRIEVKTVYADNGTNITDYERAEFVVYDKLSTL